MIGGEIREALKVLREELREYAIQACANLIEYSTISKTSADGATEAMRASDDDPEVERAVRRIEPWGVRCRPPSGIRGAIIKALGGASSGLLVGVSTTRYGPSDLEEGEVALYSIGSGAVIKINKDGAVTVTASSGQTVAVDAGAGANVVINGGSVDVALIGDTVTWTAGSYPLVNAVIAPVVGRRFKGA